MLLRLGATQLSTGGGGWRRGGRGGAERGRGGRPAVQLRPRLPADPAGHHAEGAAQRRLGGAGGRRAGHPLPGEATLHKRVQSECCYSLFMLVLYPLRFTPAVQAARV